MSFLTVLGDIETAVTLAVELGAIEPVVLLIVVTVEVAVGVVLVEFDVIGFAVVLAA